jgi:hypothetical protein
VSKATDKILALGDDAIFDPPWGGSFAEIRPSEDVLSSGYNDQHLEGGTMPYHVGESDECPAGKPHAVIKNSDGEVMGCHESEEAAHRQIAAIEANEGESSVTTEVVLDTRSPMISGGGYADMSLMSGTPWEGVLVVEGIETGDGREFALNAITWAELPLPLRRNIEDSHGGMPTTTTVLVGRIDEVYRNPENPAEIRGRGVFDDEGVHGAEALRLVRGGFLKGVSVDPDDIKDADVELIFPETESEGEEIDELAELFMMPEKTVFHAGRLRAATLCDIPAFTEAQIWLTDQAPASEAIAAAAAGHFGELSDMSWNGAVQEARLGKTHSVRTARQAYAHVGVGDTKVTARFLHHHIEQAGDGVAVKAANLTACSVGIRAINAGRAASLTESERKAAYAHLAEHLRAGGLVPPPYETNDVLTADASDDHLVRPPSEWFENPRLAALTPLTITEEGRVYGHGAAWGTCHTAFADVCTTPPREGDHSYFRLGEVVTASGERVAVGHITLGTGHAATRGLSPQKAAEHYDNTGTVVAVVASGEDDHGIWVAGAVRPGTPETRIQELRAAPLSGDWRRIGGQLRLVAFLAVNRPGFPVPRTKTFVSKSQQYSLVAAGVVTQDMRPVGRSVGVDAAMQRIARSIGRDPASRMSELKRRVRGGE